MCTPFDQRIEHEILRILSNSPVPEDYDHALNVLEWVRRLQPDSGAALQLAALGHDLERALPNRKVWRREFDTYDSFKRAHAENSAVIMRELLAKYPLDKDIVARVCYLIRYHEFGKDDDPELVVLKDADSLSFFEINLPHYFRREGERETFSRMQWGFRRLSERARRYLQSMKYEEEILNRFLLEICRTRTPKPWPSHG